jgi:tetratricopeptide (TPR) repeat protein
MTNDNLASAYRERIRGDKTENLEKAIKYSQNALVIYTQTNFPHRWANTQNDLASAYIFRFKGDEAENLDKAIEHYQNVLVINTQIDFPHEWAMTNSNLSAAYSNRIRGDRTENLEKAIECSENALTIHTQTDFPYEWAMTNNNLALAYINRIRGDRAENLERAIECCQNALTIHTQTDLPVDCLRTSKNLGDLHFTQGNWELAIQTYQKAISAIEIIRNWATNDLRRQEILAESMDVYEKMIQACINNGQLDLAIETTERSRARHLVDLMASNDLYQGGDIPETVREYLEQYEHLQERINLLRSSTQKSDNRELATSETRWRSQEILATEIAEINQLETEKQDIWQQLRRLDPILAGQQQVDPISFTQIQQLIDNNSTAILCCYSTWQDTYIFILYQDKPPQVHTCKDQKINTLHGEFLGNNWLNPYLQDFSTWLNNMPQVLAELAQRLQLDELIAKHLQGIEELIIIPHLWLHQTPFAALPVNSIPSAPIKEVSISLTSSERGANNRDNRKPQGSCPRKPPDIPENQQYLGDLFRLRILPSCQILNYCHQRPSLNGQTTMGIVANASGDLPYTAYECETLTNKYQVEPSKRLQGHQATVREYRQIASQVPILHSSHHGSANSANPLESALILSDRNLSLGELLTPGWRKDLQNLSDVYLNNCETNFSINEITDDLLSIATGFLCAGARSVVSTLWSVDDCASALLAIFYYEFRDTGASRPRALQQAQQKLRNLTGQQLQAEYLEQLTSNLQQQHQQAITHQDLDIAEKIQRQIEQTLPKHCQTAYPFASPFYWAGFISQGLV